MALDSGLSNENDNTETPGNIKERERFVRASEKRAIEAILTADARHAGVSGRAISLCGPASGPHQVVLGANGFDEVVFVERRPNAFESACRCLKGHREESKLVSDNTLIAYRNAKSWSTPKKTTLILGEFLDIYSKDPYFDLVDFDSDAGLRHVLPAVKEILRQAKNHRRWALRLVGACRNQPINLSMALDELLSFARVCGHRIIGKPFAQYTKETIYDKPGVYGGVAMATIQLILDPVKKTRTVSEPEIETDLLRPQTGGGLAKTLRKFGITQSVFAACYGCQQPNISRILKQSRFDSKTVKRVREAIHLYRAHSK